jgi:hypothetical protein
MADRAGNLWGIRHFGQPLPAAASGYGCVYTARKYIEAWRQVFQVYAAEFPDQAISRAIGNAINLDDRGRIDPGEGLRTRQAIIGAALRKSIDKGMVTNHAGRHVNYLEIHQADVLADEMQPVLRYGASRFAR